MGDILRKILHSVGRDRQWYFYHVCKKALYYNLKIPRKAKKYKDIILCVEKEMIAYLNSEEYKELLRSASVLV